MKTVMRVIAVACLLLGLAGCGTTAKEMRAKSLSERNDIFSEVKTGEAIPPGYAVLTIRAAIKLPAEGLKVRQAGKNDGYPFLLNIGGQAVLWQAEGIMEKKPAYDKEGSISRDPEAGEGLRYTMEKRVQL
ncbi:MAG: hypothetical protein HGA78_11340, partial [Nitrospirales bacterium]|nr:hypothetical protein [Nitrospirales bacterium]